MIRDRDMFKLYVDYLICSTSQVTATGLSAVTNNEISHDRVTRFLSKNTFESANLWQHTKGFVRTFEAEDGLLIVDDSKEEKPYTDENEIISWHYDHGKDQNVKGINFITTMYHANNMTIPVGYDFVRKTEEIIDKKTGKKRRIDPISKQVRYRALVKVAVENEIKFKYVLNDSWYSSSENMCYIKNELHKDFIMPIKSNRLVALSEQDKANGKFIGIDSIELGEGAIVRLQDVSFPVRFVRQVFKNGDGSTGILNLVSSDLGLTNDQITIIYKKRWNIETYHKSLKNNASLAASPTKTVRTQSNHFFLSLCAYVELQKLSQITKMGHYAIRFKIYTNALKTALKALNDLSQTVIPRDAPA